MKKNKVLVYPYDLEFCAVIRHKELLKDYEVAALVSPRGWGMTGKDAATADNGDELGIMVSNDFEGNLDLCDTVLFCESVRALEFESVLMPKILKALEHKKNIIMTIPLDREKYDLVSQKCAESGVDFKCFGVAREPENFEEIPTQSEIMYDMGTPVIFVLGMGERTNKFEVQLSLRDNIEKMGYKVSQVGTRQYCELLGFHSIPSFMYSKKISETNKIVLFNHFIKSIEMEEKPDLIIIGIPGGVMAYTNKLTNRFGVLAYEICQAVTPDSAVLACHYDEPSNDFFINLKESIRYKLGCIINCFSIANTIFDWNNSKDWSKISYLSVTSKFVDENMRKFIPKGEAFFNVLNTKDARKMSEHIIDLLSEYGETVCM